MISSTAFGVAEGTEQLRRQQAMAAIEDASTNLEIDQLGLQTEAI